MPSLEDIELNISIDSVCFVAVKSRAFEIKEAPAAADPVYAELRSFINGLTEDEQIDLVALAWIGRGDGGIAEWDSIREEAARAHNNRTAEYLLGMPLLPDYLEDALSELDHSCEEVEDERF